MNIAPIFEIKGKPCWRGLKKMRSYFALYAGYLEIELDGEHDICAIDDIIDIFIKEPVVEGMDSRETFIEYYNEGGECDYTLEDSIFPGLSEQMERVLEKEWAFVAKKHDYPDSVKWFNACNAITMIAGQQNPSIFGGAYMSTDDITGWREVLYDSWNISNSQQLLQMLPKLIDGRAAAVYKAQLMALSGMGINETFDLYAGSFDKDDLVSLKQGIATAVRAYSDKDSDERVIFDEIAKNGGELCLMAWDLQRAIYLSAIGYGTDFLSWDEAIGFCIQAGQKLQGIFSSWDAFIRCYLLGYCQWAEERLDDEGSEAYERRNIYETYRKLPNSPWAVMWGTDLKGK